MEIREVYRCRICGNEDLTPILDLGKMPLSGTFPGPGEADPPKGPLYLVKCNDAGSRHHCGLVQLKHSVAPDYMYRENTYGYRSGINRTMTRHLEDIAANVERLLGLQPGDMVLDIGSNDGTLLKSYRVSGLRRVGIDPTGEQFRSHYPEGIELISDYFSERVFSEAFGDVGAKVITSIAMFYDLEDPVAFAAEVRKVLEPEGIWVLEQSYMPTMLATASFDTVCHEHLEYYSLKQIEWIMEKNDFRIVDVQFNDTNGGSFQIVVTPAESSLRTNVPQLDAVRALERERRLGTEGPYAEFRARVHRVRDTLGSFLREEKKKGKSVFVYGASTKGNIMLTWCGIDGSIVTAAADRNPEKWGRRTPGTNIPIISEEEARARNPDYFLVLPWHFLSEFIEREADFLASGGRFVVPLPEFNVIGKE